MPTYDHEIAALRKDSERLSSIRNWSKGQIIICPPGTHGGHPDEWIVAFENDAKRDGYGSLVPEHFGATFDAAVDAAIVASGIVIDA